MSEEVKRIKTEPHYLKELICLVDNEIFDILEFIFTDGDKIK